MLWGSSPFTEPSKVSNLFQERLTIQIAKELQHVLKTDHVAVVIDATHLCVSSRGVGDTNSRTGTAHFSGKFKDQSIKNEFLNYINRK